MDDRNAALTTPRLALEPLQPHHAAPTFRHWSDPRLYTFVDVVPPASVEELERRYGLLTKRRSPDGTEEWLNWFARTAGGDVVTLVQVTIRADGSAYLAYMTFVDFWGCGYTTEACRAVIEHLESLGIREWNTEVHQANERSLRVMEKLGFERTGVVTGDDIHFRRSSGLNARGGSAR